MKPRSNKKGILIIIGALFILVIAIIILSLRSDNQVTNTPQVEDGGPGTVVVDNTDRLSQILLSEEYTTVSDELVKYIQNMINKDIDHAYISAGPSIDPNGLVKFTVTTENPAKTFEVVVDRVTYRDKIIFKIPASKFSETLQVY